MTIRLPDELESQIMAAVQSGRYASLDAAMTEAACLLVQRLRQEQDPTKPPATPPDLGSIGAMHDDAELLDQVTQAIMRDRETRTLRLAPDA
jgi:Arc/MetJ-type ribon-helix-helix transcriptional regulator